MSAERNAPQGFTPETWARFNENGYLIVPSVLSNDEVTRLKDLALSFAPYRGTEGFFEVNIIEKHPAFAALINHDAHIGYVYDLYGEASKLLLSQFFVRPPFQPVRNDWHFDGPRQLPFSTFSPYLPLRLKVGFWLTDLPKDKMGNLLVVPGSHRQDFLEQYKTHDVNPNQRAITARAGDMILMSAGLWHRVDVNESATTRINIFYEYGPSWITASDHWRVHPAVLDGLDREQRLLLRDYDYPNALIKPPAEDYPLFQDAKPAGRYADHVPAYLCKHPTRIEKGLK